MKVLVAPVSGVAGKTNEVSPLQKSTWSFGVGRLLPVASLTSVRIRSVLEGVGEGIREGAGEEYREGEKTVEWYEVRHTSATCPSLLHF